MRALPILLVEDEHALGTALSFAVRRAGHLPTLVASGLAALDAMRKERYAAVVLDIGLPDMSGLAVLERVRKQDLALPVLIITAHATLDHAINAQKLGATEYLTKPLDLRQFEHALTALLTKGMPVGESAPLAPAATSRSATLIGAAPCLQEVFLGIARGCAGRMPALITGPTGSGKTLAATVIHLNVQRPTLPVRFIECGSLADAAAVNAVLAGGEGTLVFEEITQLPYAAQSQLAAALTAEDGPRLFATSSQNPRDAVTQGTLRAELYYALSALSIPMPPLHERTGDIPALSGFFLGLRAPSATTTQITPPALAALQAYPWPGNVRELRHVLDYAATVCRGSPIFLSHLPPNIASAAQDPSMPASNGELDTTLARWIDAQLATNADEPPPYDTLLDQIEAAMLRHLLTRFDNKPTHLANALRMNRATLRQKLRRTGLQKDDEA
ncbi:MAG: two component, sigma54 specific, transcriptional regulator, Fis family [Verrucomicrobiaceae bacterium]|nr:two component, sigma54 specific, transcriptional regulator, Fis family [Verrucomicrobiaceae bacterium]